MTDKLRQRAKELAEAAAIIDDICDAGYSQDALKERIEAAILTGMREALREKASDVQCVNGASLVQSWLRNHQYNDLALCDRIYTAMAEVRARGLE